MLSFCQSATYLLDTTPMHQYSSSISDDCCHDVWVEQLDRTLCLLLDLIKPQGQSLQRTTSMHRYKLASTSSVISLTRTRYLSHWNTICQVIALFSCHGCLLLCTWTTRRNESSGVVHLIFNQNFWLAFSKRGACITRPVWVEVLDMGRRPIALTYDIQTLLRDMVSHRASRIESSIEAFVPVVQLY